jgi:signal transduction histidine kinase
MHGEEWFVRRDGSLFEIEWWSQPLQLPTGHASVFSFIDLSERRAMEQAIREREVAQIRAGEARAAQRRIVEGTTAVRRRVAHDLHDGAQRHLVSLLIDLRLAQEELVSDPAHVPALLDVVADHTQAAIDELRGFVAGIHPSILATRGLSPAVRALATDAALPVHVSGSVGRLPQLIEANAYFFVAEALTNVAKHAHASHADVSLARDESCLLVEVCDDGVGGVTIPGDGHQLAALADRIDALDGTLTIESPPRVGTTLRAEIPLSAAGR